MKRVTCAAGVIGLALTVWMLVQFGAQAILTLVVSCGWGIVAVIVFHAVQVGLSAQAWRVLCGGASGPALHLKDFFLLRCVREGINNLLPVAQVGGEVMSSRLLARRSIGGRRAAAATICDLTLELLSQVLFTCAGLTLLLLLVHRSSATDHPLECAVVRLVVGAGVVGSPCAAGAAPLRGVAARPLRAAPGRSGPGSSPERGRARCRSCAACTGRCRSRRPSGAR